MPLNIYVFQLESNSMFVYPSRKVEPTFKELVLEMTIYYEFVRQRPPIKIIEILYDQTMMAIDSTVKKYMLFFDFIQVRGGTYHMEILPPALSESLKEELNLISYIDLPNIEYIEYLIKTYKRKPNLNISLENEILIETRTEISEILEKYKNDRAIHNDIQSFVVNNSKGCGGGGGGTGIETYIIDENVLTQIRELKQCISDGGTVSDEISEIYPKLLIYLKRIYTILIKYEYDIPNGLDISFEVMVYIKNPEFGLDDFVYTKYLNKTPTEIQRNRGIQICKYYETMCQKVLNMIDERTFDLQTYEPNLEWKYERAIYYINSVLEDKSAISVI